MKVCFFYSGVKINVDSNLHIEPLTIVSLRRCRPQIEHHKFKMADGRGAAHGADFILRETNSSAGRDVRKTFTFSSTRLTPTSSDSSHLTSNHDVLI